MQCRTSTSRRRHSTAAPQPSLISGMYVRAHLLLEIMLGTPKQPQLGGLTLTAWRTQAKSEDVAPLTDVDHLLVVAGNSDEENPYRKGSAIQASHL